MQNAEAYGQALRLTETPMETNDSFMAETVEFWRQQSGRDLTAEEAREAVTNITGFFRILDGWDRRTDVPPEEGR